MDINDLVSVEEAAKILGYRNNSVALLCRQGKLKGALMKGHQWMIPRATVENYEKGAQGFAAVWERRRMEQNAKNTGTSDISGEAKTDIERELLKRVNVLIRKIDKLTKSIDDLNKNNCTDEA